MTYGTGIYLSILAVLKFVSRRFLGRKEEGKEEFLLGEDILTSRGAIKVGGVAYILELVPLVRRYGTQGCGSGLIRTFLVGSGAGSG